MKKARRISWLTLFLISVFLPEVFSQGNTISGNVIDAQDRKPVSGAIVELVDAAGKMRKYTVTSAEGKFSVPLPAESGYNLRFSAMGFQKQSLELKGLQSPVTVELTPAPTRIREVTVKAPDILQKNDTLVFNVEKFADIQDKTIGDVLKKMPGIEVAESGQIKYNGEPINKFYIEGTDMLEGRYGLATNNISHKDVKSVELMENHQPVRALEGVEHSDQAAINLRLQEDAKLRWVGTVTGGGGFSPALWDGALFAMRIAKGFQSMENFKINNTGKNLSGEAVNFGMNNILNQMINRNLLNNYINPDQISTPLNEARTRFNRSTLFNTTNTFKLNDQYQLNAQITYAGDRLTAERYSHTGYLDENIPPLEESKRVLSREHDLSGRITLQANTSGFFLKNTLEADVLWKDTESAITGSYPSRKKTDLPATRISNHLELVKNVNGRVFTFASMNQYQRKPHELVVVSGEERMRQEATASVFNSDTYFSHSWNLGRGWRLGGRAGVNLRFRELESELTGVELDYPLSNDARLDHTAVYLTPSLTYERRPVRISLSFPLNYRYYRFKESEGDRKQTSSYFLLNPALNLNYDISAYWSLLGGARYASRSINEQLFYTGAILSDYRNVSVGFPSFERGKDYNLNLNLRYKNPMNSFFANAGIVFSNQMATPLPAQLFEGRYLIDTYADLSAVHNSWQVHGGISKGYNRGKLTVGVNASYTDAGHSIVRNGRKTPYNSTRFTVSPRLKGSLFSWCTAEYELAFNRNGVEQKNSGEKSTTNSFNQYLQLNFTVTRNFFLNSRIEHYYNEYTDNQSKQLVLADIGARFKFSKWELNASATNLLNKKEYRYSLYGALDRTSISHALRKRSLLITAYFRF